VGDRSGEGTTLNNLGAVYNTLGQKDKALDFFGQALAIRREVGDRFGESVTLFNIGILLDAMDHTAEAVEYLEQNVALDGSIGHPDLESDRATLDRVRRKLGQT
jgi:tetratricopeptide (TPR) repeat protein